MLMASMRAMQQGTLMKEIRAAPHEIELFAKIIEGNATLVSTEALESLKEHTILTDNPTLRLGIIAPISTKASEKYYNSLGDFCEFCTASECKLFKCSRCEIVQYCSTACQKISWKKHKPNCRAR
jgi:hypothetical protein